MGFWIFMFFMNLLIPAIVTGFGAYFRNHAPKEINSVFGYRTRMSMKNQDTWEFAHHHCGNLWFVLGLLLLLLSAIAMLFLLGKSEDTVGIIGAMICIVQSMILIISIFPTEFALRKHFDQEGNRKLN